MHIEEPATHQLDVEVSRFGAHSQSGQELQQSHPVLENCLRFQSSLKILLAHEKLLEIELEKTQAQGKLLNYIRQVVDSCASLEFILQKIVEQVRLFLDVDTVFVCQIYPDNKIIAFDSKDLLKSDENDYHNQAGLVTRILLPTASDDTNSSQTNLWGTLIAFGNNGKLTPLIKSIAKLPLR
jgi:hypothetical protein